MTIPLELVRRGRCWPSVDVIRFLFSSPPEAPALVSLCSHAVRYDVVVPLKHARVISRGAFFAMNDFWTRSFSQLREIGIAGSLRDDDG